MLYYGCTDIQGCYTFMVNCTLYIRYVFLFCLTLLSILKLKSAFVWCAFAHAFLYNPVYYLRFFKLKVNLSISSLACAYLKSYIIQNLNLDMQFPPPSLFHEIILFKLFACVFKVMVFLSIIRDNVLSHLS